MLLAYLLRERGGSKPHQEPPSFPAHKPSISGLWGQELHANNVPGNASDCMAPTPQNPAHWRTSHSVWVQGERVAKPEPGPRRGTGLPLLPSTLTDCSSCPRLPPALAAASLPGAWDLCPTSFWLSHFCRWSLGVLTVQTRSSYKIFHNSINVLLAKTLWQVLV